MSDTNKAIQLDQKLYGSFEPAALRFKIIAQMIIGLAVFIAIILKIIFFIFEAHPAGWQVFMEINERNPLEIVSYGLGLFAALEFGYMLFTPSMGVAFRPLVLGIASVLALILSSMGVQPDQGGTAATWGLALVIAVLIVSMAAILWMRHYFFSIATRSQYPVEKDIQSNAQQLHPPSGIEGHQETGSEQLAANISIPTINKWGS